MCIKVVGIQRNTLNTGQSGLPVINVVGAHLQLEKCTLRTKTLGWDIMFLVFLLFLSNVW